MSSTTCSPGKTSYKCSTLGRKMSMTNPSAHFHSHVHHQHLHSGGGSEFISIDQGGGGGGSVLGISLGTGMRSGQQFASHTTELPMIIPMPLHVDQPTKQPTSNVPILNSILTSSVSGHNNNINSSHNNNNNGSSSSGNPVASAASGSSTSTLKKRVQIQEVTV